ncbi:MAG TPA: DOMON-like domain-containing protein [Anaerolineales bacterium]|nr:DOMON-like domain-containing protein [Anaerolineales bacterium]
MNRQKNILSVHYSVTGKIGQIFFPSPIAHPARKNDLWRTTCFEFFLAVKDSSQYWEFNLSPSGDWNVYVMDGYRQVNMREETRTQRLQFKVQKDVDCFLLEADIDLNPIFPKDISIEAGIASVIQADHGRESYWALIHPHPIADFHLRHSFILEFPSST